MKLVSSTRYGIKAILEIAMGHGNAPMRIAAVAEREHISVKYLEQLIAMLKRAGLVHGIRGPRGGYTLTKPPAEITLKEVFLALEGPTLPVACDVHPEYAPHCSDCLLSRTWQNLENAMMGVLEDATLADLLSLNPGS